MGAAPVDHPLRPARRYLLPAHVRPRLADPFGPIVQTDALAAALANARPVVAVGDVVSMTLHKLGIVPAVFVCDYKTQRGEDSPEYRQTLASWGGREIRVRNPAGELTAQAWDATKDALAAEGPATDAPVRIVVDGEEDLLGLPAVALLPEGGAMVYGMPGRGIVVAHVTPALKELVVSLLSDMHRF